MSWPDTTIDAHSLLDHVQDSIVVLDASLSIRFANAAARWNLSGSGTTEVESLNAADLLHADDLAMAGEVINMVANTPGASATLEARLKTSSGWLPIEAFATNHFDTPNVGGIVVCFRNLSIEKDLAAALEEQVTLRAEIAEQKQLLESLLEIQTALASNRALDTVLEIVAGGASRLLDSVAVELRVIDPSDRRRLVLAASRGLTPLQRADHRVLPVADGLVRLGAEHNEQSELVAPILIQGRVAGTIAVARTERGPYVEADERTLNALAEQAGIALREASTEAALRDAFTDQLTGLPNRRLLLDRLARSIERTRRTNAAIAVLFIDLDGFKAINDSRGHQVGDRILATVAGRIQASIRSGDTAARWGGDEFVVVLEQADAVRAREVADRILATVRAPVDDGDVTLYVTATVGVSTTTFVGQADYGPDPETLVRRADIAMYQGKGVGRSTVVFFESTMEREVIDRSELENELRDAIHNDSIDFALQPVISLTTGQTVGVEALARWISPTRGVIDPHRFVPIAEAVGLIAALDRLVLRQACVSMKPVAERLGEANFYLAVNMSARHLEHASVADSLLSIVYETGFPQRQLVVEVTETAAIRDPVATAVTLARLRDRGVRVAIDDFGTGYSSLTYLQRFPADSLKIDRSFVADVATGARERQLVGAVVTLAHALGLSVTAEGIETSEQAEVLRELGADDAQGHFFAPPMTIDEIRNLLLPHPSS